MRVNETTQDTIEQGPPPRFSAEDWHKLVMRCAITAWRYSGSQMSYGELYDLSDSVLREAMGDVCPEIEP